jgi:Fanconi anemia group M protein
MSMVEYVSHPLIKRNKVERRTYQVSIAATALKYNTLLILPTGLGKTAVALLVIASRLMNKGGKALVLSPTKPLVEQHAAFFRDNMNIGEDRVIALTGEVSPEKRGELWDNASVVVATPQIIENDLLTGKLSLEEVTHITFDEAHRAVGRYAYVFIAKKYMEQNKNPLILAMTASPGSNLDRIREVCENLFIEEIEGRTEMDEDVIPYIHYRHIEWVRVELPQEYARIRSLLEQFISSRSSRLKKLGLVGSVKELESKRNVLLLQGKLQAMLSRNPSPSLYEGISIVAEIMKVKHAVELVETQGIEALKKYVEKLGAEANSRGGSKASRSIFKDTRFKKAVEEIYRCTTTHPKLKKLKEIVEEQIQANPDSRIIVFTNYRDTAEVVTSFLKENTLANPVKFVGQTNRHNDKGMSQKQQVETIAKFRGGEYNVLVATSVAEEGLDIPSTDLVIFYEAVPSEIRAIQRKGRTGRKKVGKVVVLMGRGTRDEGYYWASTSKEKKMYEQLDRIRHYMKNYLHMKRQEGQTNLDTFFMSKIPKEAIQIFVDFRESKSGVVRKLHEKNIGLVMKQLDVADYVLSDRVGVERKTVEDFLESLVNRQRDIFSQLIDLKRGYQKPILLIEGDGLYSKRRIHPNAIRGALASIVIDLGVPILFTKDQEETAEVLYMIARREQEDKERDVSLHSGKTSMSLKEQQEYVISSISNIGPILARNLLRHFKTIEKIVTADKKELEKVEKIGPKIAERIREVVSTPYEEK